MVVRFMVALCYTSREYNAALPSAGWATGRMGNRLVMHAGDRAVQLHLILHEALEHHVFGYLSKGELP